jgi:Uma2 family endonuclease
MHLRNFLGGDPMSTVATRTDYTPEDLLRMPDGDRYELVNGALVELHMGSLAAWISGELFWLMRAYCREHRLGWVFPGGEAGYQGFTGSTRTVRKPDVSFVRYGRLPGEEIPEGWVQLVPDLAAEVISPNDLYEEVDEKIEEYLRSGVRRVWVVSPHNRTVRVHRPDGTSIRLGIGNELDGEDVFPGFRCRVRDLFPAPPPAGNGTLS